MCAPCWDAVARVPPPLWTGPHITVGAAGGRHEGTLRDIIHAYKYDGRQSLATPLGRLMRDAGASLLSDADCVVPVPLFPWRRLSRGFNQAADLARKMDRPVVHALWRWRPTSPQAALPAASRRSNVHGAFVRSPLTMGLNDRVVVLIDDVKTTGATLSACARILKQSGAREVRALTAATADLRS